MYRLFLSKSKNNIIAILFISFFVYLSFELSFLVSGLINISNSSLIISPVLLVIVMGFLSGNFIKYELNSKITNCCEKHILQFAIVLLGAKLNFSFFSEITFFEFIIVLSAVLFALFITVKIAKYFKLKNKELVILIAFGNAICGSSAIIILAKLIKAKKHNISLAIAAITICGTIAMFFYPVLGKVLLLSDNQFAIVAGSTVQSVPQSIATGMIFSNESGDRATIIKLIRVLLLSPILVVFLFYNNKQKFGNNKIINIITSIPTFILFFLCMSLLSTLNIFSDNVINTISDLSRILIVFAMFAVGYNTKFKDLCVSSKEAILLSISSSVTLVTFILLLVFFIL